MSPSLRLDSHAAMPHCVCVPCASRQLAAAVSRHEDQINCAEPQSPRLSHRPSDLLPSRAVFESSNFVDEKLTYIIVHQ
jgi:hypothetical protein